jgi:uncharacterized protein (TIGR03086 family)
MTDAEHPADRYRRLAEHFSKVVDAVPSAAWSAASPCEGWSAADVLDHVVSTERDLFARMPFGAVDDLAAGGSLLTWPQLRDRVQAALDEPAHAGHTYDGFFGPTTFAETVGLFYCFDLLVHSWDIARAAGLPTLETMPAADVEWAQQALAPMGDNVRMNGVLGPEVRVPDDASAQDKLLGWAGRTP